MSLLALKLKVINRINLVKVEVKIKLNKIELNKIRLN